MKGGVSHGKTDDFSYKIVENPEHVRDFNATLLRRCVLLGINHERFSVKHRGLDMRLTEWRRRIL